MQEQQIQGAVTSPKAEFDTQGTVLLSGMRADLQDKLFIGQHRNCYGSVPVKLCEFCLLELSKLCLLQLLGNPLTTGKAVHRVVSQHRHSTTKPPEGGVLGETAECYLSPHTTGTESWKSCRHYRILMLEKLRVLMELGTGGCRCWHFRSLPKVSIPVHWNQEKMPLPLEISLLCFY